MIWISILNLIITMILIMFIYSSNEFKYKNIILGLFSLNLILIIITILTNQKNRIIATEWKTRKNLLKN